jgi:predicted transcriptional regulator
VYILLFSEVNHNQALNIVSLDRLSGRGMDYLGPLKSELKLQILLSLLNGKKKLVELQVDVKSSETTILHTIKELENLNLTTKISGTYQLTSLGLLEAQMCKNTCATAEVIDKFRDFWLVHDVTAIPTNLMHRMGDLVDSTLIRAETLELGKVYNSFQEILLSSEKVMGISPIFHPNYVPMVEHLLSQGKSVNLILSSAVVEKTLELAKTDLVKKSLQGDILKIYVNENLKVALTVTDKNFSLGLFKNSGEYDDNMDLISLSQKAIDWGQELFQENLKNSVRIGPEQM